MLHGLCHIRPRHCGVLSRSSRSLSSPVYCQASSGADRSSNNVIVIGGGAAGLTAAYFAADAGAQVTIMERTKEAGKKILMSGGSRCNILPMEVDQQRDFYSESSQSAVRAIFASWSLDECKAWLEDRSAVGLELTAEPETNKWFPSSNSSRDVRDRLLAACVRRGARVQFNRSLEDLRRDERSGGWQCVMQDGSTHVAENVVLATGGMSFPAVGTDGTGLRLLKRLGHTLREPYPALTPLTGPHPAGLSMYTVRVECQTGKQLRSWREADRSGMLFTHKGYSGPSILDLSHHAVQAMQRNGKRPVIRVNWTGEPQEVWQQRLGAGGAASVGSVLQRHGVRERLAAALCQQLGVPGLQETPLAQLRKTERQGLLELLTNYPLPYDGHEGYKKAEVTGGGVALSEVDCKTMESRVLPGLYLCGEVLDVFGRIGGFNFYWAWTTGRLAGLGAAQHSRA